MELHEWREAQAQTLLVRLGKDFPQNAIQQEAGFEIGAGRRKFDGSNAITQVQFFALLRSRTEQALQSST